MEEILSINNLSIEGVLDNINISFFSDTNYFITGSNQGKTTFLKAIVNNIDYVGNIKKNKSIAVVFDQNQFFLGSVEDEIKYLLLNDQDKRIVDSFFSKKELMDNPNKLSFNKQKTILILKEIFKNPSMLFIDNVLNLVNSRTKSILLKLIKDRKINLCIVSNNIEDALLSQYMIVLKNGQIAIEGKTSQVLNEEKILNRLGVGLPFYVDLSRQLNLYGLVDKIYLNKKVLGEALWK